MKDVAIPQTSGWRTLLPGGASFPFALLLLAYALFDVLAPCALRVANDRAASPWHSEMSVEDGLGGQFVLSDASGWKTGLFMATVFSSVAQSAVFAIWIAFGCGKWLTRLGIAVIAAACLHGLIQAQLAAPVESWHEIVRPFAAIPLLILSLVTPFAIVAVLTGWRLQHKDLRLRAGYSRRRFSIADLLLITTVVAASVALAHWKDATPGQAANTLPESVLALFVGLVFSTIYVLPIAWAILAVQRHPLAVFLAGLIIATFAALSFLPAAGDSQVDWSMQIGIVCGALLTAPCSLLVWRLCGYRLVPSSALRSDAPISAQN
ncbi:MAG TPA: hypothetical protein VG125_26600 [Pirellulales bacterium]|jgi:hypothetical protein|nr:hypothetical protein [Pirellulales bacterium]